VNIAADLRPGDFFHVAGRGGAIAIDDENGALASEAHARRHVALAWLHNGVVSTVPAGTAVTLLSRAKAPRDGASPYLYGMGVKS